jgi:hypothetical protein
MNHGSFLLTNIHQEIDLLLSSSVPSVLMPALPFVFLTNELHIIPPTTLQNGQPPPTTQITKHFFQRHIEELKSEFSQVQSMGSAAAEEWIKGLEERGKQWRNDAARWEKWEASGGFARMRGLESHEGVKSAVPTRTATPSTTANGGNHVFETNHSMQLPGQIPTQVHQFPQPIQTSFRK